MSVSTLLFVLLAALMTLGAVAALLVPLRRREAHVRAHDASSAEVYRDQIAQVERDRAAGLVSEREAAEARAEIGRRLLAASEAGGGEGRAPAGHGRMHRAVAGAVMALVPVVAVGGYLWLGAPGLPAQPFATRVAEDPGAASREEVVQLAERIEARLAEHPGEQTGWLLLARTRLALQEPDAAVEAYRRALALQQGPAPDLLAEYGETLVTVAQGEVTDEAAAAFRSALDADPESRPALWHLGRRAAAAEDFDAVRGYWGRLLDTLEEGAPGRAQLAEALSRLPGGDGRSGSAQ
ncbi:c-type cytochrome biogenesis protein CcmI [Futiania mangrovi]|uniref:C-type cytochrome biogenesis protein CcmI n=1 Tax=Futiania mangrovi TaxID=2959716 RepID=A0A9J6PB20_9PROT|nr:c-type cytochrome biogenesis protein CcmI [Futiania mangrovii]MCP1336349.1 c-type cytochrome biogenesis protein CcmI [Futiania mangrovii]